jgi:predicted MFS family arabinose efflux permease
MNLAPTLPAAKTAPTPLTRGLVLLMAVANGLIVANLYYLQPVLADVARTFSVTEGQVGIVATLSQLGYAVGLLLLVPLGDTRNRRTLITRLLLAVTVALLGVAVAPNVPMLAVVAFAVGTLTISA